MVSSKKNDVKKKLLEKTPPHAKELIIAQKIGVKPLNTKKSENNQFTQERFLKYYNGYDFLQNMIAVRPFLLKKYKIDHEVLEILLYMFPKNFFTRHDYNQMVRSYRYFKPETLIKKGLMVVSVKGSNRTKDIYKLSQTAVNIVTSFYEYLAGVKQIPKAKHHNPLMAKDAGMQMKKNLNLILQLQGQPVPPTRKVFFPKSNRDDTD